MNRGVVVRRRAIEALSGSRLGAGKGVGKNIAQHLKPVASGEMRNCQKSSLSVQRQWPVDGDVDVTIRSTGGSNQLGERRGARNLIMPQRTTQFFLLRVGQYWCS